LPVSIQRASNDAPAGSTKRLRGLSLNGCEDF
jgi:hypothetical protein